MPGLPVTRREVSTLGRALVDAFGENRLMIYASAVAFRTLVALIPLTLLGIALLGATGQQKIWVRTLAPPIRHRVLQPVFLGINATVEQIFTRDGSLLIVFAAGLALLDVSFAVSGIIRSLNEILETRDKRSIWQRFAVAVVLAFVVIVLLFGAALLVTAGARIAGSSGGFVHFGVGILRWIAAIVLLGLAVALIVRFGPYRSRSKTWVSVGSASIVFAWVVASLAFKWFVSSVANYRSGAGILAAFLVLTTYVYTSSIIFLVGAQLDELLRKRA